MNERERFDAECLARWKESERSLYDAVEVFMQEWELWQGHPSGFDPDFPKELARWLRDRLREVGFDVPLRSTECLRPPPKETQP